MLIRFTVENFRSFDQEVEFSLLPGRAQKHADHVTSHTELELETLRVALLYGANASGKSNLVRAMEFARNLIVEGVRPKQIIPLEPFRLSKAREREPSRFEFEFIAGKQAYAYGFALDRRRIHGEWLYAMNGRDERLLFERTNNHDDVAVKFGEQAEDDRRFLEFVARSARPNQLLLTTAAENNVTLFEAAYEWFRDTLTIIFPETRYQGIQVGVHRDEKFTQALANFLRAMNTGIDEVCTKPIDPEAIDFPLDLILHKLADGAKENGVEDGIIVLDGPNDQRYLLRQDEAGLLETYALGTRRRVGDEVVDFDLHEESDGTQRLFDLFPVLYAAQNRVFVIDELERSLHPNLARRFIKDFLTGATQNQLVVTTHESTLLDLDLLRRDEIWFVEKGPDGASRLYSLEEFKPRHDLDVRKGYLHGRFGAIPIFGGALQDKAYAA